MSSAPRSAGWRTDRPPALTFAGGGCYGRAIPIRSRPSQRMTIRLHRHDLPDGWASGESVAIDTETLGLEIGRDRLCVVQISRGDGDADVIQIAGGQTS